MPRRSTLGNSLKILHMHATVFSLLRIMGENAIDPTWEGSGGDGGKLSFDGGLPKLKSKGSKIIESTTQKKKKTVVIFLLGQILMASN